MVEQWKTWILDGTSYTNFPLILLKHIRTFDEHSSKSIGQFTTADQRVVTIKDLSVESNSGEFLYRNYCAIDYTQEGKTMFLYIRLKLNNRTHMP